MSYQIGLDAVHLRPTPRLAHTEYCSSDALKRALGVTRSAFAGPQEQEGVRHSDEGDRCFEDLWDIDLIWHTNDGPVPWSRRGRVTDMGHADFLEGGVDRRSGKPSPFKDAEDVLAFDAVKEYGKPDMQGLVAFYEQVYRDGQSRFPNQVYTAGYYKTIVSGAIEAFGWDMLLEAAAQPQRFERVLDSFFELTLHHVKAWASTTAPVYIQHDDFVWSAGPFMNPDYYHKVIIPHYAELWKVLKSAGKKVLFCSDGDWSMFVGDIAEAGADGFIFEPMMALDPIVERFGRTHVIMGSKVDCRTLTFGSLHDIQREIDETLALAMDCPGFMFAVGNHIPSNVPVEAAMFYMEHLRRNWWRAGAH